MKNSISKGRTRLPALNILFRAFRPPFLLNAHPARLPCEAFRLLRAAKKFRVLHLFKSLKLIKSRKIFVNVNFISKGRTPPCYADFVILLCFTMFHNSLLHKELAFFLFYLIA